MKTRIASLTWILTILLLLAPAGVRAAHTTGDVRLSDPEAILGGDDLVPLDDVLAAAAWVATDRWGTATAGDPLPCTDLDGNVVCWMVPFRRDGGTFPSRQALLTELDDDARLGKSRVGSFEPPYATGDALPDELLETDRGDATTSLSEMPLVRPDGEISHRAQFHAAKRDYDSRLREAVGAERYGTVVIAARRTMHPLIAVYWFLPPYFLTGPEAARRADDSLGIASSELGNLVFLSPGEIYYRFAGEGKRVLVHAKSLQVIEDEAGFTDRMSRRADSTNKASPEDLDDFDHIWNELLALTR